MQALRLAVPALALATVLSSVFLALGFTSATRTDAPRPSPNDHEPATGTLADRTPSGFDEGETLSASIPSEDVRGETVPGLPRYPGSVRVSYSEARVDGLSVVRVGYLAEGSPGAVRDFYTGTFRPRDWEMANVEYAGGEWYLLAVHGGREAVVEVSPRGAGSVVSLEVSRPRAQEDGASAGGSNR